MGDDSNEDVGGVEVSPGDLSPEATPRARSGGGQA